MKIPTHAAVFGALGLSASVILAAGEAHADAPIVDQAFSFQTIDWTGVSDTGGTADPKSDWTVQASYRIWGSFPDRSVLLYILKQKGKALGEVRCETRSMYSSVLKNGLPHLFAERCTDRKLKVREPGEYQLEWHFIDGDTDANTLLGTDTMIVRAAPRYDLGATTRPWYPVMYPDRNGELASTVLYQRTNASPGYLQPGQSPSLSNGNGIDVIVQAAPAYSGDDPTRGSYVRCRVDGNPVNLKTPWTFGPSSGTTIDGVHVSTGRGIVAEAETPNPTGNPRLDKDSILFRTYYLELPLTFAGGAPRNEATDIGKTPGAWECDWRNGEGKSLRTFFFTVGADGRVAPHVEQTAHGLSLAPGAVYIESLVPAGNPLDVRTAPAALATAAFAGRGLKSTQALARAKTVTAVGNPLPPKYQLPAAPAASSGKAKR